MAGVLAAAKPREFCHLTGVNFLVPHQNSDLNGFPYYAEDCTNPPWPRGNDAVFCHLPLLVFQRWDATTAVPTRESILRVYRNMRYDSRTGVPTHITPALARHTMTAWKIGRHKIKTKPAPSTVPDVFYGNARCLSERAPRSYADIAKSCTNPCSFFPCKSIIHGAATLASDIHPSSLDVLGLPVCEVCWDRLFGATGQVWIDITGSNSIFNPDFVAATIAHWRAVPLQQILRGMILVRKPLALAEYAAIGSAAEFDAARFVYSIKLAPKTSASDVASIFGPTMWYLFKKLQSGGRGVHNIRKSFDTDEIRKLAYFGCLFDANRMRLQKNVQTLVVDGKPQSSIAVIVCQQHPGTKTDYDMMWRTTFLCIDQLTKPDIRVELHPLAPGCHPPDSAMAPNRRCETSALTPIDIKNADTITWAYLYYLTTYEPTSPASATIPTLK